MTTKSRTFLVLTLLFLSTGRKISPIQINTFLLQRVLGLQVGDLFQFCPHSQNILQSGKQNFQVLQSSSQGPTTFFTAFFTQFSVFTVQHSRSHSNCVLSAADCNPLSLSHLSNPLVQRTAEPCQPPRPPTQLGWVTGGAGAGRQRNGHSFR